jgi:hypothetical protein
MADNKINRNSVSNKNRWNQWWPNSKWCKNGIVSIILKSKDYPYFVGSSQISINAGDNGGW